MEERGVTPFAATNNQITEDDEEAMPDSRGVKHEHHPTSSVVVIGNNNTKGKSYGKRYVTGRNGFTVRLSVALSLIYLGGLGVISLLQQQNQTNALLLCSGGDNPESESAAAALSEFGVARKSPFSEVRVVSLTESGFDIFRNRNYDLALPMSSSSSTQDETDDDDDDESSGKVSVEWFPGFDGTDQAVLDEWSAVTKLHRLNATDFVENSRGTNEYASAHSVGCYLSHWRLLEGAWKSWSGKLKDKDKSSQQEKPPQKRQQQKRPDMLFVFEDDAHCVSNIVDRTWQVVQKLPRDWDILFVGGKPMSYHTMGKGIGDFIAATVETPVKASYRPTDEQLIERMCRGDFGTSLSGPFPPEGWNDTNTDATINSASTGRMPPYWRTKNLLNTNSYVVNPRRIRRILRVLSKPMYQYKPVDVVLSDDMFREFYEGGTVSSSSTADQPNSSSSSAPLKAFMTPLLFCDQDVKRLVADRDRPPHWQGYHWLPWRETKGFPDGTAYVWGDIANPDLCK